MPLLKTKIATPAAEAPKQDAPTEAQAAQVVATVKAAKAAAPMTKDNYWRNREARDVERDAHMAWSGLAQAALTSVSVAQLNADNTEDGLVDLVTRITTKLLAKRDGK